MARTGRILAAGLSGMLAGIGEGMVRAGQAKREQALRELEMRFRAEESEKDRTFRAGESEKDRTFRASEAQAGREHDVGMAMRREEHERGMADLRFGFEAGESEKDRAFRAEQGEKERAHSGLLAGETFTDKDGFVWEIGPGGKAVPVAGGDGKQLQGQPPKAAAGEELVKVMGENGKPVYVPRSEAAGLEAWVEPKDADPFAKTPLESAREQAEAEADEMAPGLFSRARPGDQTAEAFGGLTRAEWVERRAAEILRQRESGTTPATPKGKPETREAGAPSGGAQAAESNERAAQQPPGAGTRDDPYKATSQAQVDWFRENAPAGAVIEVNGKLYTK